MKTPMKTEMSTISSTSSGGASGSSMKPERDPESFSQSQRIKMLESRPPMPTTSNGIEKDVLTLNADLRPEWKPSSGNVGDGETELDMLVWRIVGSVGRWVTYGSATKTLLYWDGVKFAEVAIPSQASKVLITTATGIEFNYPKYTT